MMELISTIAIVCGGGANSIEGHLVCQRAMHKCIHLKTKQSSSGHDVALLKCIFELKPYYKGK